MKLTEEQTKILELLVQGKTNMQIANELGYSDRSVKRKLQKLKKLFQVENRTALTSAFLSVRFGDLI